MANEVYTVSFDWGVFGISQIHTITARAVDPVSGQLNFFSGSASGTGNLDSMFTSAGFTFTAASGASRIEFSAAPAEADSFDLVLDNVSVTGVLGAIPEPATWAMLLIGFGAIGATLRSARRKATSSAIA